MKKIVILLSIIAICHLTAARWHGHDHNHWGHHHRGDEDRENRDVQPPWWRRPDSNSNSGSDENNSNDFNPWRRSTSTTSSTTTSTLAPPVNNDDIIRACVRSCPVTPEYNPVCGSNGVTYANPGRLECAQQCGVAVQLTRNTACGIIENRNVSRNTLEVCLAACPVTLDFMPVCGTNNITYANPARLQCAKNCGVAVSIDKYDPCYRWPNPTESFIQIELTACQQSCPVKVDYVPVCGTDGRTYRNSESLQCARKCGINVNIKHRNKCPENAKITDNPVTIPVTVPVTVPVIVTESSTANANTVIDPNKEKEKNKDTNGKKPNMKEVMACMQLCPLTSEYLPICGTDGITYTNPGRLLCSQFCGIDVNVKKFAPCELMSNVTFINCPNGGGFRPPTTVQECMKSCSTSESNRPVCGTNDITYKNIDQLFCAKRCGIDVCVKKQSACDNFVTPTPDTQVTPTKESIDQDKDKATTGFTIDPDVLHSLFPDDHTKATDEFDVDERFNDKFSTEKTK